MSEIKKAVRNNNKASSVKVLFSSMKMASATLISRILGLVREQVMAAYFGASGVTDAFTIAYRVPNMLRDLFAEGAFSAAFVPIFTQVKIKDEQAAKRLLWSLVVLLGIITSIVSILIMVFAPEIVDLVTNDKFSADTERMLLTVNLVRIMAPFLVLVSLAALFMGALNSLKIFFVPSLAPAFFNVLMIACMIFLPPILKDFGLHGIFSMGIGVIAGGLAQMLVQVPLLFKKKYGPTGPITIWSKYSKQIFHRVGIGTVGIAATQINVLVTTILATGTMVGAVSWLTYAFRLFQFPVGILSVSVAGSNLVHFSEAWKLGDKDEAIKTLKASYFLSLLTIIPAFCLLLALSFESVHLIFERGAFDSYATKMTAGALDFYVLGLPFYGLYKILVPVFYALDKPKIPVIISISTIVINLVFCIFMTPIYGYKILALGTSLSMMINSVSQSIFLSRLLSLKLNFFINVRIFKLLLAGVACYFAVYFTKLHFFVISDSFLIKSSIFSLSCLLGIGSYLLCLGIMGESKSLIAIFKRKKT